MKDAQILEIAIYHIFQPHIWNSRRICSEYNITPIKFHKLQQSEAWQLVEAQYQKLKASEPDEKEEVWQNAHFNKIQDWYDQKYQLARYQMVVGSKIGRLLMRGINALENITDDFELLDQMKDYRQVIGEFSKAYSSVSGQASAMIAEVLAIDPMIEMLQKSMAEDAENNAPQQQEIFPPQSDNN